MVRAVAISGGRNGTLAQGRLEKRSLFVFFVENANVSDALKQRGVSARAKSTRCSSRLIDSYLNNKQKNQARRSPNVAALALELRSPRSSRASAATFSKRFHP